MIITVIIKRATRAIAFVCKFCHLVKREYKYLALARAFVLHFFLFSSLLLLPFSHKKRARARGILTKTTTPQNYFYPRPERTRVRDFLSLSLTLYIPSRSGLREARLKRERERIKLQKLE